MSLLATWPDLLVGKMPHPKEWLSREPLCQVEGMGYPSYVSGEGLVVANIFGPYDARLMRRSSDAQSLV